LYDYLTPKLDFKRKFNHRQLFLYKGRLTVRTIQKFRIGSSLRIESRIGSSIWNRIESRSFAGPYYIYIFGGSCPVMEFWQMQNSFCVKVLRSPIFLSFCPRLFSAVAHWMSTILPQTVWLWCEFRMQVWNMMHAARCKYRTHLCN